MRKLARGSTVRELAKEFSTISFPEFQREPNIWDRRAKQRLIDSIIRSFDIAPIYFYMNLDATKECIDGRQRLNAIMSFLGQNPADDDNAFEYAVVNEIFEEGPTNYDTLRGKNFAQIKATADEGETLASDFISQFMEYQLIIVELSAIVRPEEFNLQFTRLNLGVIINSGEKLHAMVGEMREECFGSDGIGSNPFFSTINIPIRRFAREQLAAQILCQWFSLAAGDGFTRTRHYDLQLFFKKHEKISTQGREWIQSLREILDHLNTAFAPSSVLRNRAMTLSTVLLARAVSVQTLSDAQVLARFVAIFLNRLKWQIQKGPDSDAEYRYLIDFQRFVTQASVEKPAVAGRAAVLEEQYGMWRTNGLLQGDTDYLARTGENPDDV